MKHSTKHFKIFTAMLIIFALAAASPVFAKKRVSSQRQKLISYALEFQGTPYVYGGHEPGGFDCSGFVNYVTNHGIGVQVPQTAQAMYDKMTPIKDSIREPGDLVFFKNNPSGKITHVGIYLGTYHGEGRLHEKKVFLSAVSDGPRTGVIMAAMDENFWKTHYYATARFLPATGD